MYFVLGQSLLELSEESRETIEVDVPPVDSMTFLKAFQTVLKGLEIRIVLGRLRVLLPQREWKFSCRITHRYLDHYINKAVLLHNHQQDESPPKVKAEHSKTSSSAANEDIGAKQRPRSLLQGLMEQTDDKIEIRNQIIQAMMAAQDTTSVLLSNTIFLLSRHPDVWTRLRNEILSPDATIPLTLSVLNSLSFLRNILHECNYPIFCLSPFLSSFLCLRSQYIPPLHPKMQTKTNPPFLNCPKSPTSIPRLRPKRPCRLTRHHPPFRWRPWPNSPHLHRPRNPPLHPLLHPPPQPRRLRPFRRRTIWSRPLGRHQALTLGVHALRRRRSCLCRTEQSNGRGGVRIGKAREEVRKYRE